MALTQLTKVDGGGISTTSDYRVGIITAIKFVGPFDGTGGNFTGVVTASSANFSGDVSIGGTLTYEDVTNIDSVGIITARDGIDCNGDLDVDGHTNIDNVSIAGVTTFAGDIVVPDSIVHSGDTHTKIRFPTNDQISFENGGSESMRIYGYGQVLIGDGVDRRSGNAELTISGSSSVILADNNPLYNQQNPCFLHLSNANNSVDASETGIIFHNTFAASGNVALYSKKTGTYASDLIFRFRTGGTASTERVRITSSGQVKVGTGVTIETNGQATFAGVTTFTSDLNVAENIIHTGDTDTKIRFADAGDIIQLQAGGTTRIQTNNIGARIDTTLLLYGDAGNPGRLRLQEGGALSEIMVARNSDTNSFLYFKTEISGTTATRVMIDESGHFRPNVDSTNDLGINGTRWRNVYADVYYGDGSNLSGITASSLNISSFSADSNKNIFSGGTCSGCNLKTDGDTHTNGCHNIMLGACAGKSMACGDFNVLIGENAGCSLVQGTFGCNALANVFIGRGPGRSAEHGCFSVAIGCGTLESMKGFGCNIAFGTVSYTHLPLPTTPYV